MRKAIATFCLLLIITICAGQNNKNISIEHSVPDLNGTWVLDESKSRLKPSPNEKVTDYVLIITHHEPEIRFDNRFKKNGVYSSRDWLYYTDGRSEASALGQDMEVTTKWKGKKLFRRITTVRRNPFNNVSEQTVTEEEWVLSEDAQTLTRTISRSSAGRPGRNDLDLLNEKYVLRRLH